MSLRLPRVLNRYVAGISLVIGAASVSAQSFPAAAVPSVQKVNETPSDDVTVFLSVKLNGNPETDLVPFTERSGELFLPAPSATQLGFSADFLKSLPAETPLAAYPGVKVLYDRGAQNVSITAPFSILSLNTARLGATQGARTVASASPGLVLNYDLYSSYNNQKEANLSGFTELRAFNDWGVLRNSYLWQGQHTNIQPGWQNTVLRMDTALEHSMQDKEITFRLGDTVTNGLSWSRQTRIGGVQVSRNFSLQPYQTTTPLAAYFGSAALPSAVELFVNGIQQYNGNVPAGPFELNTLPMVNGAGQAQVVLTDALGRRTSMDFAFYNSTKLLRQGLTDWSFETGYVRKDYGFRSFEYERDPMVSGTIRHGFSNALTGETHVEGSKGVISGGVGVAANIGTLGTVSASWAQSKAQGTKGAQYGAGYQLQQGRFNFGLSTQRAVGEYRDVASLYGGPPVLRTDSAYVGYDMRKLGNVALSYAYLQLADQPRYRYGIASWSRAFASGISVNLSANQNLDNRRDRSVYVGVSVNWDKGVSAYGSAVRSQDAITYSMGAYGSAESERDWNWGVQSQATDRQSPNASGQISKRAQYLDFSAGVSSAGNSQYGYAGASGSVIAMGGGVFASRRIYDGFAVVSTDGVPDVPIKNQNRVVGKTNSSGLLLVPSLLSHQHNTISLDPTNLPVDMRIERVNTDVVPRQSSGVNVKFSMETVQAASLILHRPGGDAVPLGAQVFLNDSKEPVGWVGYDGRFYAEGLRANNKLTVHGDGFDCTVAFSYQAKADFVPEIGPLLCAP